MAEGTMNDTAHHAWHSRAEFASSCTACISQRDELVAENERMSTILDQEMTFRELEMKIRDGSVSIHAVGSEEGGSPVMRLVAAMMLNLLLGEENEMPPNYRVVEWHVKPGGEFDAIRLIAEIVRPGAQSSHELRRELETKVAQLESEKGLQEDPTA